MHLSACTVERHQNHVPCILGRKRWLCTKSTFTTSHPGRFQCIDIQRHDSFIRCKNRRLFQTTDMQRPLQPLKSVLPTNAKSRLEGIPAYGIVAMKRRYCSTEQRLTSTSVSRPSDRWLYRDNLQQMVPSVVLVVALEKCMARSVWTGLSLQEQSA